MGAARSPTVHPAPPFSSPPEDIKLDPHTTILARWGWEKEVGVVVGTRFVLDRPRIILIETFAPRGLTIWSRFYLRMVQLAPELTADQKKNPVPLIVAVNPDVWAGNFGQLFSSGERMARHFRNFDSAEHHRPKDPTKDMDKDKRNKKKEPPAVVHALFDQPFGRLHERYRARATTGMLFTLLVSSGSPSTAPPA